VRRKEKQIRDPAELRRLLETAVVCRLAFAGGPAAAAGDPAGCSIPYLVPVLFALEGGALEGALPGAHLYVHSAREGRKIDLLRANPRVCFEVESEVGLVIGKAPCDWSVRYRSVIGWGRASLVDDRRERRRALDLLVRKYEAVAAPAELRGAAAEAAGAPPAYREAALEATAIIRIDIEELTGKASGG
jgi:hypothetical protein